MTSTADQPAGAVWENTGVQAEHYERSLVPGLFAPWAVDLVERVDPQPGERVLDLACGTGIVARTVVPRVGPGGAVTAVDVNADMVAFARQVSAGTQPPIEWKQVDAARTGLPDAAFDAVFCQQGLQFFPDRLAVVHEIHRLLVPGGRLGLSVWCGPDNAGYLPIRTALEQYLPHMPEAAGFVRAIFSLGDAAELGDLLTEAGFTDVRISHRSANVHYSSPEAWADAFLGATPVPGLATLDVAVRARIISDVVAKLRSYARGDGFGFPIEANVATARR